MLCNLNSLELPLAAAALENAVAGWPLRVNSLQARNTVTIGPPSPAQVFKGGNTEISRKLKLYSLRRLFLPLARSLVHFSFKPSRKSVSLSLSQYLLFAFQSTPKYYDSLIAQFLATN